MKFARLSGCFVLAASLWMVGCGNTNSPGTKGGIGVLYLATQGDSKVTAYPINLTNGTISATGKSAATGSVPSAEALTPSGSTLFVANSNASATPAPGSVSSYTVNSDGTLTAASGTVATGVLPMGMAVDSGGKFLFVANEGTFSDPTSGTVSVYSISNTTLTPVGAYATEDANATNGAGPVAVAVSPNGQFLYAANRFSNTVAGFSIGSNGALTPLPVLSYSVGTSPAAIALTQDGNFLYVANQDSNNISAFAACTSATLSCTAADGHLAPVAGSPFSAGLGPIAMAPAADSQGSYLFVADYNSNQISQYKVGVGSGVLTALSPATVSTGGNPVSVTVLPGPGTVLSTGGTTSYVYAANITSGTVSAFSYDTTTGTLVVVGNPLTTSGQPSAVAVR